MIDYHLHTPFCNHATGSMKRFVEEAINKGFREICFLDHLMLIDGDYIPSMSVQEVEFYFISIAKLREKYRDKILIKSGLEVDFFGDKVKEIEGIINRYSFDIIAGSAHYIIFEGRIINIASRRAMKKNGEIPLNIIRSKYIDKLLKMLDHDYFDFLCHLDLVSRFYPSEDNSDFLPVLDKIKIKNKVIEINTGGFRYINRCQNPEIFILKECFKRGINITIGSDAHKPEEIGSFFDDVLPLLKEVGYKELVSFEKGKRIMIPFREL